MSLRKTCMGLEHDTRNSVCCGNRLHPGQGLSCCGKQAFNPGVATCCEHNQGHTSTGSNHTIFESSLPKDIMKGGDKKHPYFGFGIGRNLRVRVQFAVDCHIKKSTYRIFLRSRFNCEACIYI